MELLLPSLESKGQVDEAILRTKELVLVLRLGRAEDAVCMELDEIVKFYYYLLLFLLKKTFINKSIIVKKNFKTTFKNGCYLYCEC